MMRTGILLAALLAFTAGRVSAQTVTVGPNTISGNIAFTNTAAATTAIIRAGGITGGSLSATPTDSNGAAASTTATAYSPSNANYSTSEQASYSMSAQGASTPAGYSVGVSVEYIGGDYDFQAQNLSLGLSPAATLNFGELVTIHRIRFGTDSTCATPVLINGGTIYPNSYLPYNGLYGSQPYYYFTPNNRTDISDYTADLQVTFGSNAAVDTFSYDFTVDLSPAGDTIVDHCIVIPTGGAGETALGNFITPVSVAGHTVDTFYSGGGDGPDGNSRVGTYSSGTASWINLVPGPWSFGFNYLTLDSGNAHTNVQVPWVSINAVAGATSDGSVVISGNTYQPFVSTPGNLTGTIRLVDTYAAANPGAFSALSALSAFGPSGNGSASGSGVQEDNHRDDNDSSSTWASTGFFGSYAAGTGEFDSTYSLTFPLNYDQPIPVAPRPDLDLAFDSTGVTTVPADFRMAQLNLSSDDGYPTTLAPGQSISSDWAVCFSNVTVEMQSTTLPFYNPVISGTTPAHTITDAAGNPLGFSGKLSAVGTPYAAYIDPSVAANSGIISFPLPQGVWTLTPSATFVSGSGSTSSTSFTPISVTIQDCGQQITLVPGLNVSINPPASCVAPVNGELLVPLSGTLSATEATVDHAWYTINGGAAIDLCGGSSGVTCGATYSTNATLADGTNNIVVYASSNEVSGTPDVAESITCDANGCGSGCASSGGGSGTINLTVNAPSGCVEPTSSRGGTQYSFPVSGTDSVTGGVFLLPGDFSSNTIEEITYSVNGGSQIGICEGECPASYSATMNGLVLGSNTIIVSATPYYPGVTGTSQVTETVTCDTNGCGPACASSGPIGVTINTATGCTAPSESAGASAGLQFPISGTDTGTIATLAYSVNGGSAIIICAGGCSSSYSATVSGLASGSNTVIVYATSTELGSPAVHATETISCDDNGCGPGCAASGGGTGGGAGGGSGGGSGGGTGVGSSGSGGGSCTNVLSATGQVLYEDLWPANGDLDFNDQNIGYDYKLVTDGATGDLLGLEAVFNSFSIGAGIENGLYLHLPGVAATNVSAVTRYFSSSSTGTAISAVAGESELVVEIVANTRQVFGGMSGFINTVPLSVMHASEGVAVTIRFATPLTPSQFDTGKAPFDLFIARTGDYGHQIHLSQYPGTGSMNMSLFGTDSDNSYRTVGSGTAGHAGVYFVNGNGLPFAIAVPQAIGWPTERTQISNMYPRITNFAASGDVESNASGWYNFPVDSAGYDDGYTPPSSSWVSAGPTVTASCGQQDKTCVPTVSSNSCQ